MLAKNADVISRRSGCEIDMGQAKNRGSKEARITKALEALESLRPECAACGTCQTEVRELQLFESRNLIPGLKAVFGGTCPQCSSAVFTFAGEKDAVMQAAAMMQLAADEDEANPFLRLSDRDER